MEDHAIYTKNNMLIEQFYTDKVSAEEFKDFIQSVKPSDFEKLINKHRESDQ